MAFESFTYLFLDCEFKKALIKRIKIKQGKKIFQPSISLFPFFFLKKIQKSIKHKGNCVYVYECVLMCVIVCVYFYDLNAKLTRLIYRLDIFPII